MEQFHRLKQFALLSPLLPEGHRIRRLGIHGSDFPGSEIVCFELGNLFSSCHSFWFVKDIFYAFSSLLGDRSSLLVRYPETLSWRSAGSSG